MSMKSTNASRRAYVRNGVTHLLFAGTVFGTADKSQIRLSLPCRVKGTGDGRVEVSQRVRSHRGPSKLVTETWSKVSVPCSPR
jgi:hypothetical protein